MTYIMDSINEGRRIEGKTNFDLTISQLQWAGLKPGDEILDLGCAAGTTSRIMGDLVGSQGVVVGMDISEERLLEAQNNYENPDWVSYQVAQGKAINYEDNFFDISWSRFLFEYLRDPEFTLNEMIRVTKPGGTVIVSDLDGNCIWHDPFQEDLSLLIERAVEDLSRVGFDPLIGRKLFGLAKNTNLNNVVVQIQPYHQIAGEIHEEEKVLWEMKLKTVVQKLNELGWKKNETRKLYEGYMEHLLDANTFSYSVLITIKGQKPL